MIINDKNQYFSKVEDFEIIPYTQSRGWYEMQSLYKPERIIFILNDAENPTIACFAHVKSFFGLKMLLIEGEAYRDKDAQTIENIRNFYEEIVKLDYKIVEVNSNEKYNFDYETAIRQIGFLRPVGLFSLPSTKLIDLSQPIVYSKNWKKNLKKADRFNLNFERVQPVTKADCEDFIRIHTEMDNLKSIGTPFNVPLLEKLCSTDDFRMFFVSKDNVRIASTIIYQDKKMGLSLYAASGNAARSTSASYFMYKELFNYLISSGIKIFDMGKLLPSTKSVNNVFLFKNGIGGEHIQLNGEWGYYKKTLFRIAMYFVKKFVLKKREV